MAANEGGSHPFNWFIIGFVVGVAATLAALLYLGVRHDHGASRETEASVVQPGPAAALPAAPVVAAPISAAPPRKVAVPATDRPRTSQRELDEQMAEDAAAAGMTSRTNPGQATDVQH